MEEYEARALMFVGIVACIAGAVGLCALHWSAAEQAKAAMQHGYSQQVIDGHVLWVKDGKVLGEKP